MIERILKIIETAKVDGKSEQWFAYPLYLEEIAGLASLGYVTEVTWGEGVGESIVKWENK